MQHTISTRKLDYSSSNYHLKIETFYICEFFRYNWIISFLKGYIGYTQAYTQPSLCMPNQLFR